MLTFFRKIRKSLLGSGPARRYFLYAIGEIALVVIGILIALQINNWNENQKQTDYQIAQLTNLRTEIISIKAFLNTQIRYFELAKVGNQDYLNIMESDSSISITPDSISTLIRLALNTDLVTSERLRFQTKIDFKLLPRSLYDDLEKKMLDWRHFAERIGADFQLIEDNREDDLQRAMINSGVPGWQVLFQNHTPTNFTFDHKALLKNIEMYAFMYYRLKRIEGIIGDLKNGIGDLDTMLSIIALND